MPEQLAAAVSDSSAEALTAHEKRRRWFEVALVLLVALSYFFLTSLQALCGHPISIPHLTIRPYLFASIQEIVGLLLLAYVLSRHKLRFRDLGLRWGVRDILSAPAVTLGAYLAYYAAHPLVRFIERMLSIPSSSNCLANYPIPMLSALPFFLLNPFFEELIVRAYLMSEIKQLTGSSTLAVIVSAAVQTSYHLGYGPNVFVGLFFAFLVFSVWFARTKRITPVILAHEFIDLDWFLRLTC